MLQPYTQKRDFARTREPRPAGAQARRGSLRFVVQKHAARRLHYDFRLEWDGALKSWAVPQGPSLDNAVKRLAVHVEDHPLDYAAFEGVIADGNYGAGEVVVWDTGVYSPDEHGRLSFDDRDEAEERMRRGYEKGKLSFTLRGHKLRGSWTLVRMANSPKDWLLIKHRDAEASTERDVLADERSVLSGLTVEDLKAGKMPDPSTASVDGRLKRLGALAPVAAFPAFIKPMMAKQGERPFSNPDWLFEPKLDGYRIMAFVQDGDVRLVSRNAQDYTARFREIARELAEIAATTPSPFLLRMGTKSRPPSQGPAPDFDPGGLQGVSAILDGEVVALDADGRPQFDLLQRGPWGPWRSGAEPDPQHDRVMAGDTSVAPVVYYPFDLLYLNGRSLLKAPLVERKALLSLLVVPGEHVQPIQQVDADGLTFYEAAVNLGLEGVIAKRKESTYQPGARSPSWLKIKAVNTQELVIGGYTAGEGVRSKTFGSLLMGYYDGDVLRFAGGVGTGFDDKTLERLLAKLRPLAAETCPFAPDPELAKLKATWVRPELVAQVKFAQWTSDDRIRAGVFLGLRDDKDPKEVVREQVVARGLVPRPAPRGATDAGGRTSPSARRRRAGPSLSTERESAGEVETVLAQLESAEEKALVEIDGYRIGLTNLNKPLWPATAGRPAVTKRELIAYYVRMSPWLLPHLRDRPLTLTRYPDGIDGESFYQKHADDNRPEFVETVRLFSSHNEGDRDFIMANNLATLVWIGQLGTIELHPWLSRVTATGDAALLPTTFTGSKEAIERSVLHFPDFIVFDLDPYIYSGKEKSGDEPELNRKAFTKVAEVSRSLKDVLDQLSLSSYVKTSGKTGLHIYVPVLRQYDYTVTRKACELIGRFLMQQAPRDITMEWSVDKRAGKIFLDHNQNVRGKNMASIYSLRPAPGAPVSTPVRWDELDAIYPTDFTIDNVPSRVADVGDLWSDILDAKHDLKRLVEE